MVMMNLPPAKLSGSFAGSEYRTRAVRLPAATAPGTPALCFVHGMEESWQTWTDLAEHLVPEHASILLDLPWSGRAGYEWTISSGPVGDWIGDCLSELSNDSVVLVAHSYGAMAVLDYLDRHGLRRVAAAVLVSPFYLDRPQRFDWPRFDHYASTFPRFLEEAIATRSRDRTPDPEVTKGAAEIVRQKIGPLGCLEFVRLYSRMPSLRLNRLTLPILILAGERDIFSVPSESESLAAALPRASVKVLPGCGHFSITEDTAAVAAEMTSFLRPLFTLSSTPRTIPNE